MSQGILMTPQQFQEWLQKLGQLEHTLYELTRKLREKPKLRKAILFTKSVALSTTETLKHSLDYEAKILEITGWCDSALVKVRILDPKSSILERPSTGEEAFPMTTQQFKFSLLYDTWERNKEVAVEFQNTDASNAHIPVIVILVEKAD